MARDDREPDFENANEDADAILRTGEADINEELSALGGYREFIRENYRLSED